MSENSNYDPYNHYGKVPSNSEVPPPSVHPSQQRQPSQPPQQPQLLRGVSPQMAPADRTSQPSKGNAEGIAVMGLIAGVFSIMFSFHIFIGLFAALVGLAIGLINYFGKEQKNGLVIAGIVTSTIGLLASVGIFVILMMLLKSYI